MNENLINDNYRHGISKLAGPMNDPLIDPVAAIRRVSESVTYCDNWKIDHDAKLRREAARAKRAKTLEADWDDILEANKELVNEIRAKVEDDEVLSVSEILERQKENENKIKNVII